MRAVVLQPTGSKVSRVHYNDTVNKPVNLVDIEKYVERDMYNELKKIYPDGKVYIWGVTSGKNEANFKKWNKVNVGSVTFFSANKVLFASGVVTLKVRSKKLAQYLWGINAENETWECVYFLDSIKNHYIEIAKVNELIGYKSNFVVQGFMVLDESKSQLILERYELQSERYLPSLDRQKIKGKLKKLFSIGTDTYTQSKRRNEQELLRELLIANEKVKQCSICGEDYPIEFLHAAHIKKRSLCTEQERLDVDNIVMLVCKFGCDDLYEKGYIVVDEGKTKINKKSGIPLFDLKLENLLDKDCTFWNDNTKKYFEEHSKFHKYEKY